MKNTLHHHGFRASLLSSAMLLSAQGASPLSDPLTGFFGDTSVPATQAALAAAGLEAASLDASPAVSFDASGAHFGLSAAGDGGRNYLRTVASDYANASFVAEITMTMRDNDQAAFLGFGAGGVALFGTPDWSTPFSSASFWPEPANDKITGFRTQNDINQFLDTPVAGFDPGTHRFRLSFDLPAKTLVGELDMDYAGGAFTADKTTTPIDLTSLFAADGWPSEPSRIFFGGDDGITYRDLVITTNPVIPEASTSAWLLGLGALAIAAKYRRTKAKV